MIGNVSQDSVQRADAECFVCGNGDAVRSWLLGLQDDMATGLVDLFIAPAPAKRGGEIVAADVAWALSSESKHFIADQMKADAGGLRAVEVERANSLFDVGPQLVPGVSLGEDALGQALSAKAAVGLLGDLEDNFVHYPESK